MIQALKFLTRSIRLWWESAIPLTLYNIAWLLLQIPIVTGPPATAAMFAIARKIRESEFLSPSDGWQILRQMFFPALKWGAVNLVLGLVTLANLIGYQQATGLPWVLLRLIWIILLILLYITNLFYWPLWLAQYDRRMVNTYRNALVLMLKRPGLVFSLAFFLFLLIGSSLLILIPIIVFLMAWIALSSELVVHDFVQGELKAQHIENRTPENHV